MTKSIQRLVLCIKYDVEHGVYYSNTWQVVFEYGQLGCVRVEQELKVEGSSVSVSMSGNANGRDRNEEMYSSVLKALESESEQRFLKKKPTKNKTKKLMLTLEQFC